MKKERLVVVSSRLPGGKAEGRGGDAFSSYGLVNTLLAVMAERQCGIWMGWTGRTTEKSKATVEKREEEGLTFLGVDLPEKEVNAFFHGFCQSTLWPLCHLFQNRIRLDGGEQETYSRVNEEFARQLIDRLEPGDVVWVNDYPLVPLGQALRQEGFTGPLGFFLHIPFPPVEMIEILTDPLRFMESWLYYDLVGFHTDRYGENYFEVMARLMLGVRESDRLLAGNRRQRVIINPIGIDLETFVPATGGEKSGRRPSLRGLNPEGRLLLSVDRLDYTKGIPERLQSFEYFFHHYREWRGKASLVQICSPSRTRLKDYREQKAEIDALVGRINSEWGEHDWTPVHYLYRHYSQEELALFYREAQVGLVTPLRDGMNLVALEYVAAQDPANPGVLVLSRFTGVAEYLHEAVLVNPFLPDSLAEGIDRALTMSLRERRDRYHALFEYVSKNTVQAWAQNFLQALTGAQKENAAL